MVRQYHYTETVPQLRYDLQKNTVSADDLHCKEPEHL